MNHEIYNEIARLISAGQEAAVATIVTASGSSPREAGAKMLVRSDGSILGTVGGGNIEKEVIQQALAVMRQGKAQKIEYRLKPGDELGMICGGDVEVFIEPVITAPRLFIFGAGHIAVPLAQMAALVGFNITVIDDREGFATAERFPASGKNITGSFASAFENLSIDPGAFMVIITHGHKGDEDVLAAALKTPARYVGMIGSKEKNNAVYSHLLARGYTQQDIDRVHAPIGMRIKAQTPAEIAVSILAELILVKSNR